jgi:hypothetical protein
MKTNPRILLVTVLVTAVSLAIVSASLFAYNAIVSASQSPTIFGTNSYYNGMNGMTGSEWSNMLGMMGGNGGSYSTPTPVTNSAQSSVLPLLGFVTLIGAALTGTSGAAYYFVRRPKVTFIQPSFQTEVIAPSVIVETPYDSVSKTLTVDERKVVDVLTKHNGEYLQKYIRTETGLSRLRIHRIVARLAGRGIVTLEQSGNTNKVHLSSWLAKQPFSKVSSQDSALKKLVIEA